MKFKISLSQKVLLSIGSLITLALVAVLYISHKMMLAGFARLEKQEIRTDVERACEGIEVELENLTSTCGDWAPWDDTRNFMLGKAPDYIKANLPVDTLENLNLNFMIFVDTSGRIFHTVAYDLENSAVSQVPSALIERILADKSLLSIEEPNECKSGLIILPEEVSLVAVQPISNSHNEKPISGTLIMGRYLNDNLIKAISDKMILDISMVYNDGPAKAPDFAADPDISRDKNIVVRILDKDNAAGFTNIYDIDGSKYITLKVNVPREIYSRGHQTVHYFMAVIALAVVIMLVALLFVMQKIILRPINKLTKNLMDVGSNYDTSTKLYMERGDEIGTLARSFDAVMENLKKRMSQLNASDKRFEEVAENSGDWIWEVNAEGLYTYSSPVVEKVLGYKPREIVGKKYFYDFFAPDQREKLKKAAFEAFARREKFNGLINSNIHKNGSIVILETHGTPIVDDKGKLCGYRGADRDITDRKRAEERLMAVNTLQELLLPPVPIEQKLKFITDAVVRIVDADFARIWVIKPGDRCDAGCTHAQVTEGPHVCRFRNKCLHLVASSGRYTHLDGKGHCRVPFGCYKIGLIAAGEQTKFLTNDATTDPRVHNHAWARELGLVSFAGYRLTHTDGTTLGVLALFSKHPISPVEDALLEGIAHSTSKVLHASLMEDALRKNEEFTRRVIESSSDCIKVLDLEGHLLSMSEGGQKLLEIDDMTPYLNSSFIDFWKGKEREDALEAISKAKQGDTGIFYGYFETAKGTPKWWEVIITPIKDADGSINRLLAVSRDITDRKKAEESIKNLNKELKETVKGLTFANRELVNFAYVIAHDLKAPLRAVGSLAGIILADYSDKLDKRGRQYLNTLVSRTERMSNLITGILRYSELGRTIKKQQVDLNEVVREVIVEVAPPENVEIIQENDFPAIMCGRTHMVQVFQNLLSNAVKFMDKPKGYIRLGCVEENGFWQFSIADNGCGIKEKYFEKIFQVFQTLTRRDEVESVGIGLSIVKKIVERYDGRIWVESEPQKGSTFYFTLPKQEIKVRNEKFQTNTAG